MNKILKGLTKDVKVDDLIPHSERGISRETDGMVKTKLLCNLSAEERAQLDRAYNKAVKKARQDRAFWGVMSGRPREDKPKKSIQPVKSGINALSLDIEILSPDVEEHKELIEQLGGVLEDVEQETGA